MRDWSARPAAERAAALRRAADLYEENAAELTALATREAGKTLADAIAEVREAVDFLRYYADAGEAATGTPRGVMVCISPWNFPLAIFTGQVAACLGAGNAVIAKPAEQTPLIAARAVELMHAAGVPAAALQLLPGDGPTVGGPLTSAPGIAGVCFTGSTEVARLIHRALAENAAPDAVLIAETGGLNAMIVDSTALTEQVVRDVLASAFQSAGQRCSALRILYVQEEARGRVMEMLSGAMEALSLGDPWDADHRRRAGDRRRGASSGIAAYLADEAARGKVLQDPDRARARPLRAADGGRGRRASARSSREIFGPVLHVASFRAAELDRVVDAINARGFGLTCGLHSRIDDRVERVTARLHVGNVYVNRNQIGAIVGSQPFGGEGLSGTGPKAGGPFYLPRLQRGPTGPAPAAPAGPEIAAGDAGARPSPRSTPAPGRRGRTASRRCAPRSARSPGRWGRRWPPPRRCRRRRIDLPGPTGESNRLSLHPRGRVLCLGAGLEVVLAQAVQALAAGNAVLAVAAGAPAALGGAERAAGRGHRRPGRRRKPGRAARAGAGRRVGARGLAAGAAAGAQPARRSDRAAGDGAHRARALPARAPPLHRHHRGRRQRQPARRERLSRCRASPTAHPPLPASLLVLVGVIALIEVVLSLADAGILFDPSLRSRVLLAGAFWGGLLHGAKPLYAAQPVTMFLSHALLHGSLLHMVMNMTILLALGRFTADRYGPGVILPVFFLSAIAGGACFGLLASDAYPMVGASGAVFGFLGVWIAWDWRRHRAAGVSTGPVLRRVAVLVVINVVVFFGLKGMLAWQAHLGGFLAGLACGGWLEGRLARANRAAHAEARRLRAQGETPGE